MNLFDILGPVMVGPSSSHTAGAVRMGSTARKLLGEPVRRAEVLLYGSFLATGRGHGTPRALVAGLLGMQPDDSRIPSSLELAEKAGVEIVFGEAELKDAHPNSAELRLTGESGKTLTVVGESVGGSRINIASIDGLPANFSGEHPTLIVRNLDQPGYVAEVTERLASEGVNIAQMRLNRSGRGGHAVMVVECDEEVPEDAIAWLRQKTGIQQVTYYSPEVGK